MSHIHINSERFQDKLQQFEFSKTAIMDAGDMVTLDYNGIDGERWTPKLGDAAVYQGQLKLIAVCTDSGAGSQAFSKCHTEEVNILFEYNGTTSVIAHNHQYFQHSDAHMNGTYSYSVNASQGIDLKWTAPSGASGTTFKIKAVAKVLVQNI